MTNPDPKKSLYQLFGPDIAPLEDRMSPWPWVSFPHQMDGFLKVRELRCAAGRLFGTYVHHRMVGNNLEFCPLWGVNLELSMFLEEWWKWMSRETKEACFELLLSVHLYAIGQRGVCYRPEFAFLVNYADSFTWAFPYRNDFRKAEHGLSEMSELFRGVPLPRFLEVFYGAPRLQDEWWDACCRSQPGVSGIDPFDEPFAVLAQAPLTYQWEKTGMLNDGTCCRESNFELSRRIDYADDNHRLRLHSELGELCR